MWNNVDTSGLTNAINSALNDLNSNSINEISTLSGTNVLNSSLKSYVVGKLNDIQNNTSISGSIATLRNNLNTLKSGVSDISSWQNLYKEIQNLEDNKWCVINPAHEESYTIFGKTYYYTVPDEWGINPEIQAQIDTKKAELTKLEYQINATLNSIN